MDKNYLTSIMQYHNYFTTKLSRDCLILVAFYENLVFISFLFVLTKCIDSIVAQANIQGVKLRIKYIFIWKTARILQIIKYTFSTILQCYYAYDYSISIFPFKTKHLKIFLKIHH